MQKDSLVISPFMQLPKVIDYTVLERKKVDIKKLPYTEPIGNDLVFKIQRLPAVFCSIFIMI